MIDRNGRLFGKISIIDVVAILVVVIVACAMMMRSIRHDATVGPDSSASSSVDSSVMEEVPITLKLRVRGARTYIADAIWVGDEIYESGRDTKGAVGTIVDIERSTGYALAEVNDGTVVNAPMEDGYDLLITVSCEGVETEDDVLLINGVYELGFNASRVYYSKYVSFTASVMEVSKANDRA